MQVIKPEVEYWGFTDGNYDSNLSLIERAGRVCYKSEDKIGEGTAELFVKKLIKAGHLAMVEHSNFVIRAPLGVFQGHERFMDELQGKVGKFLTVFYSEGYVYIGGNLTAWINKYAEDAKNGNGFDLKYYPFLALYGILLGYWNNHAALSQQSWTPVYGDGIPVPLRRYTIKFICDRGVSHELVRHRICSLSQESTRYCNYKNEPIKFVEPWWYDDFSESGVVKRLLWQNICRTSAMNYRAFLEAGGTPQGARALLPNSLKTEVVVTADMKEWQHIFNLRCDAAAHPDMVRVMKMAKETMKGGLMSEANLRICLSVIPRDIKYNSRKREEVR